MLKDKEVLQESLDLEEKMEILVQKDTREYQADLVKLVIIKISIIKFSCIIWIAFFKIKISGPNGLAGKEGPQGRQGFLGDSGPMGIQGSRVINYCYNFVSFSFIF